MTIVSNLVLLAGVLSHCLAWFNALPEPGNHFERQDEAYSHKANRCARSQGFSVNVKLFQKNIQWKAWSFHLTDCFYPIPALHFAETFAALPA